MADKKEKAEYDIGDNSQLYYWDSPDDTISPFILGIYDQIAEAAWNFSGKYIENGTLDTPEKQFDYVKQSVKKRFALPKELINFLHDNKTYPEILRRYVGLFLISQSDSEISDTVNAFLLNRPLFEYFMGKFLGKPEVENEDSE